jgi:hypothetical protein
VTTGLDLDEGLAAIGRGDRGDARHGR